MQKFWRLLNGVVVFEDGQVTKALEEGFILIRFINDKEGVSGVRNLFGIFGALRASFLAHFKWFATNFGTNWSCPKVDNQEWILSTMHYCRQY